MGNIDGRCKFQGGYLYVKTDKPFYYPGQKVLGKIYIRSEIQIDANNLELRIKGKEKCSYWYDHHEHYRDSQGNRRTRTVRRKRHYSHPIINYRAICFTFQGPLNPGDFTIPFEFDLPNALPASIMWKRRDHRDKPKATVKYSVKARLLTHSKQYLKYKQMLVIHEPPVALTQNQTLQQHVNLVSCCCNGCIADWCCHIACCCGKGTTGLTVAFDKNVFYSNEIANSLVTVDNSKLNMKIAEVEFQVVQRIRLPGWAHSFDILENKDRTGINGLQEAITKQMQLNLGAIRYSCDGFKKKKLFGGAPKPRTPEEIFMLTQMAPASHSRHISNDYFLNVNVKYEACNCCSNLPSISQPLTVIPLTNPATYGFLEPQGYAPFELGYFKFQMH